MSGQYLDKLVKTNDLQPRSWSTSDEYLSWFREKVWGGMQYVDSIFKVHSSCPSSMLSQAMFNREKWMNAIILDPVTGLDPPGVKVRAAQGKLCINHSVSDLTLVLFQESMPPRRSFKGIGYGQRLLRTSQ